MQPRQLERIAPVGLDAVTRSPGNERRRGDHAVMTGVRQLTLDPITARAGFVTKARFMAVARQPADQPPQGVGSVGDLAINSGFTSFTPFGERNRNRLFVHIQTDERDRLLHDPSPMHEARRWTIQRNPR
jgi:hypothetical protein